MWYPLNSEDVRRQIFSLKTAKSLFEHFEKTKLIKFYNPAQRKTWYSEIVRENSGKVDEADKWDESGGEEKLEKPVKFELRSFCFEVFL